MKEIISIPNASRTVEAFRSLGYDLNSAIADVVDNAVTEKVSAKNITIDFFVKAGNITCRIQDDGCGMSGKELEEAMRFGAETTYKDKDLGKFGMGMKTASLSHCNVLTVISKKNRSEIVGCRWDVGHVNKNGWKLLGLDKVEIAKILQKEKIDLKNNGTIILWDDLTWLNEEYKSYDSNKLAQNFYFRILDEFKLHLSMVYHRFLDGSLGKERTVRILVNKEKLSPWDPFCRKEPNTEKITLKKDDAQVKISGYRIPVKIGAYTLPDKKAFSSEKAWKEAKGLLSWNDAQGYYIYRADRIIRFGGWQGTKAKDEHDKLARISIDIDPSLDKAFKITVNKAKVHFHEALFQHLKLSVNPLVVKKAKSKYGKSSEKFDVRNNFRKNGHEVLRITQEMIAENGIKILKNKAAEIQVSNPAGTWLSNKVDDFLKYGTNKDFEIVSANLDKNQLWKIVCDNHNKFKVIVNAAHPFYSKMYKTSTNKAVTDAVDALIFSLAFAELYNKNDKNSHLFDTFKAICAQALARLTKEEVI
jgi:hypothetical protein